MVVNLVRSLASSMPLALQIAGRKRDLAVRTADVLFRWAVPHTIDTKLGPISIDPAHEPERALAYYFGNFERYYARSGLGLLISERLRQGGAFVDIGANLGIYSYLARLTGADAYPVEPEPKHATFLRRNEGVFGRVSAVALSDSPGDLPLYYWPGNPGAQSLLQNTGTLRGAETVKVLTFSELASTGALGPPEKIKLIKVDVEGFEEQVIAGMVDFLRDYRPLIWCEVRGAHAQRAAGSDRRVRDMLGLAGYRTNTVPDNDVVFDLLFESV